MASTGLVVDDHGFEVVVGGVRVGSRRLVSAADARFLAGLAARYARAVRAHSGARVLAALGRELFRWLDGDEAQLTVLLERAGSPVVFEVAGPWRPSDRAWTVLRAPFELLTRPDGDPDEGFLAEDGLGRFCVVRRLGAAGDRPEPDGFRLGVAFMASSPRGQHELDFEAEEAAILRAAGQDRIDLVVEDSGDPQQFARRLADLSGMPVVHLSCHGVNSWRPRAGAAGVPVLMMEDDAGGERPTTAQDLAAMVTVRPRLLFVSACLTATGADVPSNLPPGNGEKAMQPDGNGTDDPLPAHSLATALVAAGMSAVLGWDGSVSDRAATLFAERLYTALANRADLAEAVGDARRALLGAADLGVREEWHLARLWLGPGGGGVLVSGRRRRPLFSATQGIRTFLAGKPQVPVASAEMFVGRRLELQRSLRALRSGQRMGVVLRGQGRLGKSSLAARIADRCPDHAVAVVFGDYTALGVLDAVAAAVRTDPASREVVAAGLVRVRERPEAIEGVLTDLLSGPCAQRRPDSGRPLLLIIDDLEQILQHDHGGPHRIEPAFAPTLAAVLRAFDPAVTDSRLLLTSRFAFTLGGLEGRLEDVQLAPLSPVARRKLQRRQQSLASQDRVEERVGLAERAVAASRGNPGLQDLAVARLVYGEQVSLERAETAVAEMEVYLRRGDLPADVEVREFLENLALDALLAEAGPSNLALLRATTLFTLPVPVSIITALATEVGGSSAQLCGLGLFDPYPDLYDPAHTALAASPLPVGRITPLTSSEQTALATTTVRPLLAAWGGPVPAAARGGRLNLELAQLALLAEDPDVAASSAAGAVGALRAGPAAVAARFAQQAIALLDRHRHPAPLDLLLTAADAAFDTGDGDAGEVLLSRAARQAEAGDGDRGSLSRARVTFEQGCRLITRGELGEAEELLRRAWRLFTDAGSELEAAIVMGSIADMAFNRGDYDESLRIRHEIELPVYERLGDTRSAAVVWGCIADIAHVRGDYDEALRIRHEVQLPAFERLGDARSAAVTWGSIADIAYERGDYDEALRIRHEVQLPAFERLGDTRSAAVVWGCIADITYERGDFEEALRIRREIELPVYMRLGDTRSAAITWGSIADIAYERGDYDEAAELQEKRLEVNQQLGDLGGIAAASWGLARIDLARKDQQAAIPRLIESFKINSQLQRPEGIAGTGTLLGQLLLTAGQVHLARLVLGDAMTAAERVGRTDITSQISELLQSLPPDQGAKSSC